MSRLNWDQRRKARGSSYTYPKDKGLGVNNERDKPKDNKNVNSGSGKKTAKRHHSDIPGIDKQMGYPIARGPGDDTGDSLMIKCIKYEVLFPGCFSLSIISVTKYESKGTKNAIETNTAYKIEINLIKVVF